MPTNRFRFRQRRHLSVSRIIVIVGLLIAFLVPWLLEPHVPLTQENLSRPRRSAVNSNAILQNAPRPNEHPTFDLAVPIGAELSGACLQDRDGFIWIGTFGGGLYRYDGQGLKRFSSSTGDLNGSNVTALYEDAAGVIWIGTLTGLSTYDKRSGRFSDVDISSDTARPDSNGIWTLHGGSDGVIWIGTNGQGLLRYDSKSGEVRTYRHAEDNASSIPGDSVYRIAGTADERLLIATFGGGAARLNPDTGHTDLHIGLDEGLDSLQTWSVFEDSQQRLWVGTQNGLTRYEPDSGATQHFQYVPGDPLTLGGPVVTDIREDIHGAFWVTTFNGEASLSRINPDTMAIDRFGTRDAAAGEMGSSGARTVFEDQSGLFWVVGLNGLARFDRSPVAFNLEVAGGGLLPMYEDSHGTMWLGTIRGLRRFDHDQRRTVPVADSELSRQLVTAFAEDSRGRFWIGLYGGDLVQFDNTAERVIARHRHDPDNAASLPENNCIRRIIEDVTNPGHLWLLTQEGGLADFDTETGVVRQFVHTPSDPESLCSNSASYGAMIQDADGTLWIGTDTGLDRTKPPGGPFEHFHEDQRRPGSLQSNVVQVIHRDRHGTLWVGTSDGLHRLIDEDTKTFRQYTVEDGLSDNMILGILEAQDRLWLSTANGLTQFDPSGKTPPQVYRNNHGSAQGNSFRLTSFFKTQDNQFWFGGSNGVTHFNPDSLQHNTYVPPVVLTKLTQSGVPMELKSDAAYVDRIDIRWPASHFEFQAAALSYSTPALNRYRYRLDGHDQHWIESENGFGRYTGLHGGHYLLRVQGSNSAGVWNRNGVAVSVVVQPALWNTRWFRMLALIVLTAVAAGIARHVEFVIHEANQRKEVEQKLYESELRYRSIVEDQKEMVVRFDLDRNITFSNAAYAMANNTTPEALIGESCMKQIHPDDHRIAEQTISGLTPDHPDALVQIRVIRGTEVRWCEWNGRVLLDENRRPLGYQVVGRDITQLRDAKMKLSEREAQITHLGRVSALGELVAGISHEIKQPLASIVNFASAATMLLNDSPVDDAKSEKLQSWIERISSQADRINAIIQRLRRFSKPHTQRCHVRIEVIINEALQVLEYITRPIVDAVEVECAPDLPELYVDQVQIEQVMVNVVRNACDAIKASGKPPHRLAISAVAENDFVKVTVEDSGPGISSNEAGRIFESFVTSRSSGVGIGLAISRTIIEAHGGKIFAVPQQPGGRIVFTLPVAPNA